MDLTEDQRADELSIFISSAHADKGLEEELHALLLEALPHAKIRSTSHADSIDIGQNWHEWLRRAARNSSYAIVVISPASISRPWTTWEAGALSATIDAGRLLPIAFQLDIEQIPQPWSQFQILRGDRRDDVFALVKALLRDADEDVRAKAARRLDSRIPSYIDRIHKVLDERRRAVTDDVTPERARQAEPVAVLDNQDLRMLCELLFRLVVKGRLRPEMLQSVEATAFWAAVREDRASASTLDDLRQVNAALVSLGAPGALWASWMQNVRATELASLLRHGDITIRFP